MSEEKVCQNPNCNNMHNNRKFCSLECAYGNREEYEKDVVITYCKNCGNKIKHKPWIERKFCDQSCQSEYQNKHNDDWGGPPSGSAEIIRRKKISKSLKRQYKDGRRSKEVSKEVRKKISKSVKEIHKKRENYGFPKGHNGFRSKNTVECDWCGKEFHKKPSKVEKTKHNFCSRECMGKWQSDNMRGEDNPFWRGGKYSYYGPNWGVQRRKVLQRDGYACIICGKTEEEIGREPDVHHIKPLKEFERNGGINFQKANRLENLITLCPDCHKKIEFGGGDKNEKICNFATTFTTK